MEKKELMKILQEELKILLHKSQLGDSEAHVEWAIGKALYEFMDSGYELTDLEWFKGTTLYTGDRLTNLQAA